MKLFSAKTSQAIDQDAIDNHGIAGILLMKRAAWFAWQTLQNQYPNAQSVHILCGTGNNGGDGFALAQYALINGLQVQVSIYGGASQIQGDALIALQEMQQAGIQPQNARQLDFKTLQTTDVIVDALVGTGLNKPIKGELAELIDKLNQLHKPVLALDIASGIHADNGSVQGTAVKASHTCTFITQKLGLHTAFGPEHCGQIHYSSLFINSQLFKQHQPLANNHTLKYWLNKLPKKTASHHKGTAGTCCLIGGNTNMMGAIQLAAYASLKSGAGLTKVISRSEHLLALTQAQPELMCYSKTQLSNILATAKAMAIGPGLGQDNWATELFQQTLKAPIAKVIDADALKQLKPKSQKGEEPNWVLTPHPGEAAGLLGCSNADIQNDRISAIKNLQRKFGGVVVLKGNGTLIYDGKKLEVCLAGNAGMAVGGMGDVLTGAIASFLAQGLSLWDAANLGVSVHAHAGDILAQQAGQAGVIPSEVATTIAQLLSYSGSQTH